MNLGYFWQPSRQVSTRLGGEALWLRSRQDGVDLVHHKLGRFQIYRNLHARTIIAKAVLACGVTHGDALWDQGVPRFEFGLNFQESSFLASKIHHGNLVTLVGAAARFSLVSWLFPIEESPYKAVSNNLWSIWVSFTCSRNRAAVETSKLALVTSIMSLRSSGTSSSNLRSSISRFEVVYEAW